jgi:hypothetical protein
MPAIAIARNGLIARTLADVNSREPSERMRVSLGI